LLLTEFLWLLRNSLLKAALPPFIRTRTENKISPPLSLLPLDANLLVSPVKLCITFSSNLMGKDLVRVFWQHQLILLRSIDGVISLHFPLLWLPSHGKKRDPCAFHLACEAFHETRFTPNQAAFSTPIGRWA
jgi:hypothetical protein